MRSTFGKRIFLRERRQACELAAPRGARASRSLQRAKGRDRASPLPPCTGLEGAPPPSPTAAAAAAAAPAQLRAPTCSPPRGLQPLRAFAALRLAARPVAVDAPLAAVPTPRAQGERRRPQQQPEPRAQRSPPSHIEHRGDPPWPNASRCQQQPRQLPPRRLAALAEGADPRARPGAANQELAGWRSCCHHALGVSGGGGVARWPLEAEGSIGSSKRATLLASRCSTPETNSRPPPCSQAKGTLGELAREIGEGKTVACCAH